MNAPTTRASAPPRPSAGWPGDDFPGWLSPMLVKELRQGVQSGAFAWTFILLQAGMFVLMTFWLLATSTDDPTSLRTNRTFHGFFWSLLCLAAVFVLPLRASASMASERTGNTLDLLRLTRLSSTQIVVGKWLAVMAQVLLLATAVLPYLVLQYFFGGLDLVADLFTFVVVILAASMMTAASVSTAGQPPWSRGLFVFFAVITGFYTMVGAGSLLGIGTASLSLWSSLPAIAIVAGLVSAVFLVYSAAAIAPPAENHSLRVRLLAIVAAGLALAATSLFGALSAGFVVVVAVPIVAGIAITELNRDPVDLLAIHAPFARLGLLGPPAAAILTPGWATGVCFILATAPILALAWIRGMTVATSAGGERVAEMFAIGVATILFPLPIMLRFPAGTRRRTAFFLTQVVSVIFFLFLQTPFGQSHTPAAEIYGVVARLFPLASLLGFFTTEGPSSIGRGSGPDLAMFALPMLVTGVAVATLLPRLAREIAATAARVAAAGRLARAASARSPRG